MSEKRRGRKQRTAADGRTIEEIAVGAFKTGATKASEAREAVNRLISEDVGLRHVQRLLLRARKAGKLPPSPYPGPYVSWPTQQT
jgi:hypothetical protein